MVKISSATKRAQLELIAKKLSQGYTDTEVINELQKTNAMMKRATFYKYKAMIFKIWGDVAAKKSEESLQFEADVLKDRYIRLYRNLELRIQNQSETLHDVAVASEVAATIATNILRLEVEGLKAGKGREKYLLENRAERYLGYIPTTEPVPVQDTTTAIPTPELNLSTSSTTTDKTTADDRRSQEEVF